MLYSVYCTVEITMLALGLMCFIALYFIPAGYGKLINKKWGFTVHTRLCTQTGTDSACVFLPCALHSAHADFPDATQGKQ